MEEITTSEPKQSFLREVTPFSKYFALLLFIVLPFVGVWVGYTYAPAKIMEIEKVVMVEKKMAPKLNNEPLIVAQKDVVREETATNTQKLPIDTSTASTYTDKNTGISFSYPSTFGHIRRVGCMESEQELTSCDYLVGYGFTQSTSNNETNLFLSVGYPSKGGLGRDGFWGDQATILNQNYLTDCKKSSACKIVTSDSGIQFAKYTEPTFDWGYLGTENEEPIQSIYYAYTPGHTYTGIVLTPMRINNGDDAIDQLFEDMIIKSFSFIK